MLSRHTIAQAAQHTLRDEGVLPPISADDVEALEEEFGVYPFGSMSVSKSLKIANGELQPPKIAPILPFAELDEKIQEGLGIAARGGSAIPPEMWAKMLSDRKKAEDERNRGKK